MVAQTFQPPGQRGSNWNSSGLSRLSVPPVANWAAYDYDENGSLTQATSYGMGGATTLYGYDSRNRLTSWAQGNGSTARSAAFEYDGAGSRTRMQYTNAGNTAANTDTRYLQDATGMAEALQEINDSRRNSYLYAPGSTSPFAFDEAGTAYWYHHDGLGSIRATTTATGTVQTVQSYSAFGSREIAFNNGVNSNPIQDKGTHGFAGEQSDPTGLSYNRARYYDPTLGRFIQRDTVVGDPTNPLSMNLFVYTQNNPTDAIDPSGNSSCKFEPADCDASGGGDRSTTPSSSSAPTSTPPTMPAYIPTTPRFADLDWLVAHGLNFDMSSPWESSNFSDIRKSVLIFMEKANWSDADFVNAMTGHGRHKVVFHFDNDIKDERHGEVVPWPPLSNEIWVNLHHSAFYIPGSTNDRPKGEGHFDIQDTIVHELAHVWDRASDGNLSNGLMHLAQSRNFINITPGSIIGVLFPLSFPFTAGSGHESPWCGVGEGLCNYNFVTDSTTAQNIKKWEGENHTTYYPKTDRFEDFAVAVGANMFPSIRNGSNTVDRLRLDFVATVLDYYRGKGG